MGGAQEATGPRWDCPDGCGLNGRTQVGTGTSWEGPGGGAEAGHAGQGQGGWAQHCRLGRGHSLTCAPWAPMSDPHPPHASGGGTWGRKGKFLHWPPFSRRFLLPKASPKQFSLWVGGLKSSPGILNAPPHGLAGAGPAEQAPSLSPPRVSGLLLVYRSRLVGGTRRWAPTAANSAHAFKTSTRRSRLPQPSSTHIAEPPAAGTLFPVTV